MGLRLNLGCNDRFREGFLNVDICAPADIVCDLEHIPWPWDTNSVEEIIADDILEHISPPARYPIIALFNEIWRVLKPRGIIRIFIPTTDGRGAFQDPTHRCVYNRNSFFYVTDGDPHRIRFGDAYGIKARFKVVHESESMYPGNVSKLAIYLEAVK